MMERENYSCPLTSMLPEGMSRDGSRLLNSRDLLSDAMVERLISEGRIFEGRSVLCDGERNLHIDIGGVTGIIPRDECVFNSSGQIKDIAIISRVGKNVCFKIKEIRYDEYNRRTLIFSRRDASMDCYYKYVKNLCAGQIINAKITHLESFGAFVDIGCGIVSLLPVDCISVSRISHPKDRFTEGQEILAVVKTPCDERGLITLSHRELLGTWEENVAKFEIGQTVDGIVRSVEPYGIFIELSPNLAGLAEYRADVEVGMHAAVFIKNIIPEKMKLKLVIVDTYSSPRRFNSYDYTQTSGKIDYWCYSPRCSDKLVESFFKLIN